MLQQSYYLGTIMLLSRVIYMSFHIIFTLDHATAGYFILSLRDTSHCFMLPHVIFMLFKVSHSIPGYIMLFHITSC
jgi:hypothetical protein